MPPLPIPTEFVTRVRGVRFKGRSELARHLNSETQLRLVPEPDNPVDPMAIRVEAFLAADAKSTDQSWHLLGYVSRFVRGCARCMYVVQPGELALWCPRCGRDKIDRMQLCVRLQTLMGAGAITKPVVDYIERNPAADTPIDIYIHVCVEAPKARDRAAASQAAGPPTAIPVDDAPAGPLDIQHNDDYLG